jgi:hypothetical protein
MNPQMLHVIERLVSARHWQGRLQRWREKMAGVDFSTVVFPEEIGLDPRHAQLVAPSGNRWLRAVLDELGVCAMDAVLDVGCGKGSAMRVMLEFPFSRVDGVEAAEQIARIARTNFATLRVSSKRHSVITADASTFTALDHYNFIYFYNPFSCEVMASFMANLRASLTRAPRLVTIVYDNPVCHDTVVEGGVFRKSDRDYPDETGNRIYVYSNPSRL